MASDTEWPQVSEALLTKLESVFPSRPVLTDKGATEADFRRAQGREEILTKLRSVHRDQTEREVVEQGT